MKQSKTTSWNLILHLKSLCLQFCAFLCFCFGLNPIINTFYSKLTRSCRHMTRWWCVWDGSDGKSEEGLSRMTLSPGMKRRWSSSPMCTITLKSRLVLKDCSNKYQILRSDENCLWLTLSYEVVFLLKNKKITLWKAHQMLCLFWPFWLSIHEKQASQWGRAEEEFIRVEFVSQRMFVRFKGTLQIIVGSLRSMCSHQSHSSLIQFLKTVGF